MLDGRVSMGCVIVGKEFEEIEEKEESGGRRGCRRLLQDNRYKTIQSSPID